MRPIAAGALSAKTALATALARGAVLAAAAAGLSLAVGATALILLLGFIAPQLAYFLGLKHLALLDVFAIASLFVIHAVAALVRGVD